jgi:hypothetical protein
VGLVMFGPKGDGVTGGGRRHNVFSRVTGWLSDMWN